MSTELETIIITVREYKRLIEDSELLLCLERTGVDNWSGWDIARELRDEIRKEKEDVERTRI